MGRSIRDRGNQPVNTNYTHLSNPQVRVMQEPSVEQTDHRYCRICYNSEGWRRPTGDADETTGSYYATNGFGHEEWLFNYEWCINGYKYGFLQPFNGITKHRGKWFSLKLYRNFGGRSLFAGTISKLYAPHTDELRTVYDQMKAKGWTAQMYDDVSRLKRRNLEALNTDVPELFINVRFRREHVRLSDERLEYPPGSKPRKTERYRLLHDKDGNWIPEPENIPELDDPEPLLIRRAAQEAIFVDLAHRRLQVKLHRWLCQKYGRQAVGIEIADVDLRVTLPEGTTFYEIKMATTAKKCIREALGQLLEYAVYPTAAKASKWVVVGDPAPTPEDIAYLTHLRTVYNMPICYAQFEWEPVSLREPV